MIDFRAELPDLFADGEQIREGLGALAHVSEQGGGMVDGGELDPAFFLPLAVIPGDAVILPDELHGGDPAQDGT